MARRSDLEEAAIEWVKGNCDPDDVFGDNVLRDYVSNNNAPEEVFTDEVLGIWAEENGYIKQAKD